MSLNLEQLGKILVVEQSKGYTNEAVMGGLDSYLRRLAGAVDHIPLPKPSYAALDRGRRQRWVEGLLHWLEGGGSPRKPPQTKPHPQISRVARPSSLDSPIADIGITPTLEAKFRRLGVGTVWDFLYFFPRRHLDYSRIKTIAHLEEGIEQTVVAWVWQAQEALLGGRWGTQAVVGDDTGNIRVVWFNQAYLAKRLRPNSRVIISGKVGVFKGWKVFESPEYELLGSSEPVHTARLVPVYPLTEGLWQRTVRRLMKGVVDHWAPRLLDFLPPEVRHRAQLLDLPRAITQAHFPESEALKGEARRRLAFDELFLIQLGVLAKKHHWQEGHGYPFQDLTAVMERFQAALPFTLTQAQHRVLKEILSDLEQPRPMSRLLQGEVGSGKTVVATAALLVAVANDYQGALMAPTEILAEQHFHTLCRLIAGDGAGEGNPIQTYPSLLPRPVRVGLLTGSLGRGIKEEVRRRIEGGEVDIVVGTHALIQEGVEFRRLGLVVVDEQHRFGVMQRSALRQKGLCPHVLVMSATPIPRTLALTLYGDLDLSIIDELPPGRQEIKTKWLEPEDRERAYRFLRSQIATGRQAFIICPLIEESATIEAKAAIAEYQRLSQEVFPDLRLGLLHGRMAASEKDEVMYRFRAGELDILVSTPVVEVGIDVPNATVMLVEGADRFGLSQLHQFRGRVGRGEHQSYCLLLAEAPSAEGRERLALIERTQDGFLLAEEDLRLRGPGEFFGTRQSGLPDLRMARLSDVALLELAREEAARLFEQDPGLEMEEHQLLAQEVSRWWRGGAGELS